MNKINLYDSILSPLVTEKSTNLSEMNKVVFKVNSMADKKSIKKSVEKIFKVNVIKINIINKQRRIKLTRGKKTKDKNLIIFEDIKEKISKTKQFIKFLKTNRIISALIVVDLKTKNNIELSARNIPNIKLTDASYLTTYDIIKYKQIMFTESSTKELEKRLIDHE